MLNNGLLKHIYAFFSALIVSIILLNILLSKPRSILTKPNLDIKSYHELSQDMSAGVITVFGSSELFLTHLKNIPNNFFRERLGEKVNIVPGALIRAGVIESRLQALKRPEVIANGKLVIIVSPEWFTPKYAKRISKRFFLREFNQKYLYELLFNPFVSEQSKRELRSFLEGANEYDILSRLQPYIDSYFVKPYLAHFDLTHDSVLPYSYKKKKIDFEELYVEGIELEKLASVGNPFGISQTPLIIRGYEVIKNKVPVKREVYLGKNKGNHSLVEFYSLVSLLKEFKHKPLIVIPDLNHHGYKNKHLLNPLIKELETEILRNKFGLVNLWTNSVGEYQKGIMNDVWHLGEAGWVRVNEGIYSFFIEGNMK